MIPLFKVHCPINIGSKIEDIFKSGTITEGVVSDQFEKVFADYIGNPNTCMVNSCTSALTLAAHVIGIKPGDEVITTALTSMATYEPLYHTGARLVFADIDANTGNIDFEDVKRKIRTGKTKAIVGVHLAGQPFDIDEINSIAKTYDIKVIEDAAHALGAEYNDKKIGNHSDFVCFSFQAIKHLTTVDGGAILCKNKDDAVRIRKLRWFGLDRKFTGPRWEQDITECGFKMHMNNITAVIGLEQMKVIDEIIGGHIRNGRFYDDNIKNSRIRIMKNSNKAKSSYWIYPLLVENRQNFQKYMFDNGVAADIVHYRNDDFSVFKKFRTDLPVLKEYSEKLINIPAGWWVSEEDCRKITDFINAYK